MLAALNIIKLFLLISLGFLYLIGLGWLGIGWILNRCFNSNRNIVSLYQEIPILIFGGLIINYGLVLIFHSLDLSLIIGSILAFLGAAWYLVKKGKTFRQYNPTTDSIIKFIGVVIICGLIIGPTLLVPLSEWDARSIWFFHSKMIYSSGSFGLESGWLHASASFSHTDYPKLIPVLAAQIMHIVGFWNEYLPKLSIFFLLVPAIILLFTFYKRSFSFLLLIVLIPLSFSLQLVTGYMDGYLVLYFAIAMLLLGRFYREVKPIDLISSAFCLLLTLYIKNEGMLALIVGIVAILITLLIKKVKDIYSSVKHYWPIFTSIGILLIPFGLWSWYKHQWGLTNDLEIGSQNSFIQLITRVSDGSIYIILKDVYFELKHGLMLLVFLLIASISLRKKVVGEIVPIITAAIVYWLGIITVYLITPRELIYHLDSSVDRTVLAVTVCTYIACYFLVDNLEKNEVFTPALK